MNANLLRLERSLVKTGQVTTDLDAHTYVGITEVFEHAAKKSATSQQISPKQLDILARTYACDIKQHYPMR